MSNKDPDEEPSTSKDAQKSKAQAQSFNMTSLFTALESNNQTSSKSLEEEMAIKARLLVLEIQGGSSLPNSGRNARVTIDKSLIKKEYVDILMNEFEMEKSKAEIALSTNDGDLFKAMMALVC